eukprot:5784278-Amphidinium_carterae.1
MKNIGVDGPVAPLREEYLAMGYHSEQSQTSGPSYKELYCQPLHPASEVMEWFHLRVKRNLINAGRVHVGRKVQAIVEAPMV